MVNVKTYAKVVVFFTLLATAVSCEDVPTSTLPGPYVAPPVKGDDGRQLLWEPGPMEAQCYEPSFSPDGTKVAVSYRYGPLARAADLAVLDLNTGELKVIVEGNCAKVPGWSPTGEWIAYNSSREPAPYIWLCGPDGSDHYRLDQKWAFAPRWGPEGDKIYFSCVYEAREKDYAVYFDLKELKTNVLHRDHLLHVWNPTPAPGGEKVALRLHNPDVKGIDVNLAFINNNGTGFAAVWPAGYDRVWISPVDWSPSGRYILLGYSYPRHGSYEYGAFDVKANLFQPLTLCPPGRFFESLEGASWGPNGDIIFASEHGSLYLVEAPE